MMKLCFTRVPEELLPGIRVILTDENGNQMNLFNFSDAGQKEGDAQ